MSKWDGPTAHDVDFLRDWLKQPGMGDCALLGADHDSYSVDNQRDIVAIHPRQAPDLFSRWFTDGVVPKWHACIGRKLKVRRGWTLRVDAQPERLT
jgi:hypothetical protein